MGVFEELGPFVRFGQCIGQFPYRIETDSTRVFNFSLCQPVTFRCILVSVATGVMVFFRLLSYSDLEQELESSKMSAVFSYITRISLINFCVMFIIVRIITYRYERLKLIVKSLSSHNIRALEEWEHVLPNSKTTLRKRTVIGISFILAMVFNFLLF